MGLSVSRQFRVTDAETEKNEREKWRRGNSADVQMCSAVVATTILHTTIETSPLTFDR